MIVQVKHLFLFILFIFNLLQNGLSPQNLESRIKDFVCDQNGNHVIQKVVEVVEPSLCQFILDAFSGQVVCRYYPGMQVLPRRW